MIEFIRNHPRVMQFLLLLIVAPAFLVGGGASKIFSGDVDATVAKVGSIEISQHEFDQALQSQGPSAGLPEVRKAVLDNLIAKAALALEAHDDHINPTRAEIGERIVKSNPQLLDPRLNKEQRDQLYSQIALQQGTTPAGMEQQIGIGLTQQQFIMGVGATSSIPASVATRIGDYLQQQREVQELPFKISDFTAQVKLTDEMLKAYYDKNLSQYQNPEQAKIEYVVLSIDNIAKQVVVPDADVDAYYKAHVADFSSEAQWRASHILVAVKPEASAADKAAAKDKAAKLLAEARKNPAGFAKLAKENSDDPVSAERGGDLDFFDGKAMVKPFEDAVQKMKVGEISDLVQSNFGYHIIMLTDTHPATVKPLETVKPEITATLQKVAAKKTYTEVRDTFEHSVFEQSDSLKPTVDKLADKVKLSVESASVTRKINPDVAQTVPYNSVKFLNAVFGDDALKNKHNTDAIEVREGVLVSGRIAQYQAASQKPFDEVKAQISETMTQDEAKTLAKKAAAAKLTALQGKDDAAGFAAAKVVSRREPAGIPPAVAQTLMKTDASKLPAFVQVDVPDQGTSVYRINKILPPANPDPTIKSQLDQMQGETELSTYLEALKVKAKVKIVRPSVLAAGPATQTTPAPDGN